MRRPIEIACVAVVVLALSSVTMAVSIPMVPVGNPGNMPDSTGYGVVAYEYNIGKYEVTNAQYCEFLNKVAATDTYLLYHESMGTGGYGGILRGGSPGNYTYTTRANHYGDRPVNYVDWGDAARFANWLHNGQPTGVQDASTTEDGAYNLNGARSWPDLMAVTRETDWEWAIASEDEWYKAAYYDGGSSVYYDYPTGSNTAPTAEASPGTDPVNGSANYGFWALGSTPVNIVGSYTSRPSDSPYGTFDQGGNFAEWNESIADLTRRYTRGGGLSNGSASLSASARDPQNVTSEHYDIGFRVVQVPASGPGGVIPEPMTMLAVGLAITGLGGYIRKRRIA